MSTTIRDLVDVADNDRADVRSATVDFSERLLRDITDEAWTATSARILDASTIFHIIVKFWIVNSFVATVCYHRQIERYIMKSVVIISIFVTKVLPKPHENMPALLTLFLTVLRGH